MSNIRHALLFLLLFVWTIAVAQCEARLGLTVSDDPLDGGANLAARVGVVVIVTVWVAGVSLSLWAWRALRK